LQGALGRPVGLTDFAWVRQLRFHFKCMNTRMDCCIVCVARMAVQRSTGVGKACYVRVATYEPKDVRLSELEAWLAEACRAGDAGLPPPPSSSRDSVEVSQGLEMTRMLQWDARLVELQRCSGAPSVELVESVVRAAPTGAPPEALAPLAELAARGRDLVDSYELAMRLGADVDKAFVLGRCQRVLDLAPAIPLDLSKIEKKCGLIVADGANRYCKCQRLHDGSVLVGCEKCDRWFHPGCVGLEEDVDLETVEFVCADCAAAPLAAA
jgi:hypothetical protein